MDLAKGFFHLVAEIDNLHHRHADVGALIRIAGVADDHLADGRIQCRELAVRLRHHLTDLLVLPCHLLILGFHLIRDLLDVLLLSFRYILDIVDTAVLIIAAIVDRRRHLRTGIISARAAVDMLLYGVYLVHILKNIIELRLIWLAYLVSA